MGHRASAATHPVGFLNRPFGLPFGGHLQRRAAQPYAPIRFSPPDAVSASPKEQRRPHGVWSREGRELPRAPRTDPYVRLSRIRLPPRVRDGKALVGPGVKYPRLRKAVVRELLHPSPGESAVLAASAEYPSPPLGDLVSEDHESTAVRRHGVAAEQPPDDPPPPFPLLGGGLVHPPSQDPLDVLELRPHAVAPGLPFDQEAAPAGFAADEGEA